MNKTIEYTIKGIILAGVAIKITLDIIETINSIQF